MPLREWLVQALYLSQSVEMLCTYVKKYGLHTYVLGFFWNFFNTTAESVHGINPAFVLTRNFENGVISERF